MASLSEYYMLLIRWGAFEVADWSDGLPKEMTTFAIY